MAPAWLQVTGPASALLQALNRTSPAFYYELGGYSLTLALIIYVRRRDLMSDLYYGWELP
jgi:hypothetical protein